LIELPSISIAVIVVENVVVSISSSVDSVFTVELCLISTLASSVVVSVEVIFNSEICGGSVSDMFGDGLTELVGSKVVLIGLFNSVVKLSSSGSSVPGVISVTPGIFGSLVAVTISDTVTVVIFSMSVENFKHMLMISLDEYLAITGIRIELIHNYLLFRLNNCSIYPEFT